MFVKPLSLLLAAGSMLAMTTPGVAQEFFLRERLKGLPPAVVTTPAPTPTPTPTPAPTPTPTPTPTPEPNYTYEPRYSTTYGACSGGFQSAPIILCTRSDGAKAANSLCGADKQSISRACAGHTCSAWKTNNYANGSSVLIGNKISNPTFTDRVVALRACEDYAETFSTPGACMMQTGGMYEVRYVAGGVANVLNAGWRGSTCTRD